MPNSPVIIRALTAVQGLSLLVDGYPDRAHKLQSRIGGEPLEDGREVTDHVVAEPKMLDLTGSVSDFGGAQRPIEAWQAIEELWQSSEPVRVVTEWQTYDEMVIHRCQGTPVGRGLRFQMELRQILRAGPIAGLTPQVSTAGAAQFADALNFPVPAAAQTGIALGRSSLVARGRVPLGSFGGPASGVGVG